MWFCILLPSSGPLHWQPAVSGPQQTVGCYRRLPSCLCTYDDEAGTGTHSVELIHQINYVQFLGLCNIFVSDSKAFSSHLLCFGELENQS